MANLKKILLICTLHKSDCLKDRLFKALQIRREKSEKSKIQFLIQFVSSDFVRSLISIALRLCAFSFCINDCVPEVKSLKLSSQFVNPNHQICGKLWLIYDHCRTFLAPLGLGLPGHAQLEPSSAPGPLNDHESVLPRALQGRKVP